ncbi:MAG: glutamine synthetase III [Chlamydiales bacterium]|nr:glutamine synthetase III [Chlamydiales bacterium]
MNPIKKTPSTQFANHVFSHAVMKQMLPKHIYDNIVSAANGSENINSTYLDTIAHAMKEWAISFGATHFTHWFQPLTGMSAEKHDAFINLETSDTIIENFSGKELIQGEPDASSFPSGGLRNTHEARGYTAWSPSSPVFLWKLGNSLTLTIPSIFYSWTEHALDSKIPLLRSDKKLSCAVLRLLNLINVKASSVFSTLGIEQEYFIIDKSLRDLRADLVLLGRTVFGASPAKAQELQDHYFGAIKERVMLYMQEFEERALELGIPVRTRHNEVAPAQHEIAPIFEKTSLAIDHNLLLMELMRQVAEKHDLSVLLHEKPFAKINGSGKHCNWSLSTDTGINLLDPTETPENNLTFLILVTAVLHAVDKHAELLRASIGSLGNDSRLGGHEAPPAIISVYLGSAMEAFLDNIEKEGTHTSSKKAQFNIDISGIPTLSKDHADRNRTSPFAFTGNKFEFRAVGASANPSLAITTLNAIVAESLNEILDKITCSLTQEKQAHNELSKYVIPIIQSYLKNSKRVRFSGDNYSLLWQEEAKRRGLACHKNALSAFEIFHHQKTHLLFKDIFSKNELLSRYSILKDTYINALNIQTRLMLELFNTQILPACLNYQKMFAKSLLSLKDLGLSSSLQTQRLKELLLAIDDAIENANLLISYFHNKENDLNFIISKLIPSSELLRKKVDLLEQIVDDKKWPLPKYREMLFII